VQKQGGSGRGREQAESLGMPQLTQGQHAANIGAGSQTTLGVNIKGMSWPLAAQFMEKTHFKHLPADAPELWRARRQRNSSLSQQAHTLPAVLT